MMEKGIRKIQNDNLHLQFSKKKTTTILHEAHVIRKDSSSPSVQSVPDDRDRTDTNVIAPLTMHFYRSKSVLDSLKRVFKVFRRRLPLGAPV